MEQNDILDSQFAEIKPRRRNLLPWWIKVFTWLYLLLGAMIPIILILGLAKYKFNISLFGLETNDPLSALGLFLVFIILLKGISAFGLWFEKDWAIIVAQIDAILSIATCVCMMIYPLLVSDANLKFRLELILLIPYLLKINSIKLSW